MHFKVSISFTFTYFSAKYFRVRIYNNGSSSKKSSVLYSNNNAKEFCFFKWQNSILFPGLAYLSVSGTVLIKLAPHFVMELMDKIRNGDQLSLIYARGFFLKKLQRFLLLPIMFKHKGLIFLIIGMFGVISFSPCYEDTAQRNVLNLSWQFQLWNSLMEKWDT